MRAARPCPARRAASLVVTACLVALPAGASVAHAADLPRVFFTPAERAAISRDRLAGRSKVRNEESREERARGPSRVAVVAGPAGDPAGDPASGSRGARVEGVTIGRDRARAVWIGGERIADGARWRGYRVQVTDDGARLVAADGAVRRVRVGMEILR